MCQWLDTYNSVQHSLLHRVGMLSSGCQSLCDKIYNPTQVRWLHLAKYRTINISILCCWSHHCYLKCCTQLQYQHALIVQRTQVSNFFLLHSIFKEQSNSCCLSAIEESVVEGPNFKVGKSYHTVKSCVAVSVVTALLVAGRKGQPALSYAQSCLKLSQRNSTSSSDTKDTSSRHWHWLNQVTSRPSLLHLKNQMQATCFISSPCLSVCCSSDSDTRLRQDEHMLNHEHT